jgi:hypothetical protein
MNADCLGVGGGDWLNRIEQVTFFTWPAAPGNDSVELSYTGSAAENDACTGRGEEQITVVVQSPSFGTIWRTVTLEAGGGFIPVLDLEP